MSKAVGGVRKVVDVFEDQAVIKPKSSVHSHRSSSQDENKISHDLHKLKPFSPVIGRSHNSFVGIACDPLENLNEEVFSEWLKRHQNNILRCIFQQLKTCMEPNLRRVVMCCDNYSNLV